MITLTEKEKADRFDALQTAFLITQKRYTAQKLDATSKYRDASIIGAYNKGLADAYEQVLDDLERWII